MLKSEISLLAGPSDDLPVLPIWTDVTLGRVDLTSRSLPLVLLSSHVIELASPVAVLCDRGGELGGKTISSVLQ